MPPCLLDPHQQKRVPVPFALCSTHKASSPWGDATGTCVYNCAGWRKQQKQPEICPFPSNFNKSCTKWMFVRTHIAFGTLTARGLGNECFSFSAFQEGSLEGEWNGIIPDIWDFTSSLKLPLPCGPCHLLPEPLQYLYPISLLPSYSLFNPSSVLCLKHTCNHVIFLLNILSPISRRTIFPFKFIDHLAPTLTLPSADLATSPPARLWSRALNAFTSPLSGCCL